MLNSKNMNGVSISDFIAQCKTRLEQGIDEWGIAVIVVLVAVIAFGLGRLSAAEDRSPIRVVEAASSTLATDADRTHAVTPGGAYVASRTGKAYYFPWCTAADKISEQNKVWFKTEADAKAAGYTPAKNCKGLAE